MQVVGCQGMRAEENEKILITYGLLFEIKELFGT